MISHEIEKPHVPERLQRILSFADGISNIHSLAPVQAQMLRNFARINFRINEINEDFATTDYDVVVYPIGENYKEEVIATPIPRDSYEFFVDKLKLTAFNLYVSSLRETPETKRAAKDVVRFTKVIFSENTEL